MENNNDVRTLVRKANEARQIGLLYDMVPRKHDYSNLILELKSLVNDLAYLETMDPCLYRDNIITLIKHRLETGNDLFNTLESSECLISEMKVTIDKCEQQIKSLNQLNAKLKSELAVREASCEALRKGNLDRVLALEDFAIAAMSELQTLSSPSFINFSKKDRLKFDDMRHTYNILFNIR